ncbi:hypothetical protein [Phormidium sp. CCY1219]|nr:hypothetical protein [Phormidium sp. CCY1219]MEB3826310.1 hypothetical protein [Phormidium sp. CCY1219]
MSLRRGAKSQPDIDTPPEDVSAYYDAWLSTHTPAIAPSHQGFFLRF